MLQEVKFFEDDLIENGSRYPSIKKGKKTKNIRNPQQKAPREVSLKLREIIPMTENQEKVYDSFENGNNIVLHGTAGTGKTFISAYLAMSEMLLDPDTHKKVVIVRSTVPTRDVGFLPGNEKEKAKVYELPYNKIFADLYGRGDAYEILKKRGSVEFEITSFLRGTTFENSIIIFDEFQNAKYNELMTVLTRVGKNCRVILSGDYHQSDMRFEDEKSGMRDALAILKKVRGMDFIEFEIADIVRSGFVKELLIAEENYFKIKGK